MKPNKTMQDFNHIGIKYRPNAVDVQAYPLWMPVVFWAAVAAVFVVVGFAIEGLL